MRGPRAALRVVALSASCAGLLGCTAKPNLQAIGTSNGSSPSTSATGNEGGATVTVGGPNPIPTDFRTALTRVSTARFVSKGHAGGRWEADVYGTAEAVSALREDRGAVPVGTRLVEEQFERGDAGTGPVFMMEKRAAGFDPARGDWRYVAVGSNGEVAGDGAIESCAGCHGDAPHDHLFRVLDDTH